MGWKEAYNVICSKPVTEEIRGRKINFYPVSFGMAPKVKPFGKKVFTAISVLMQDTSTDAERSQKSVVAPTPSLVLPDKTVMAQSNSIQSTHEAKAISIQMAQHRDTRRDKAINDLLDAFFDDLPFIAGVLADSMRDEFPRGTFSEVPQDQVQAFANDLDLPLAILLFKAWMKANKESVAPLVQLLPENFGSQAKAIVQARLDKAAGKTQPMDEPSSTTDLGG